MHIDWVHAFQHLKKSLVLLSSCVLVSTMQSDVRTILVEVANRVYQQLGPGLSEAVYTTAMVAELSAQRIHVEREVVIYIHYTTSNNRTVVAGSVRADMIVEDNVVVELKAVSGIRADHELQCRMYMRHYKTDDGYPANKGIVINFPQKQENGVEYLAIP